MDNEVLLKKYKDLLLKKDDSSLFELLDVIIMMLDEDKLHDFIDNNAEHLLKVQPVLLIGKHVSFYLAKDDANQALEVLKEYQEAPFISLTVDDFMNELEEEIKKNYFSIKKDDYTRESLIKDLYSQNVDCVSQALKYLSSINIRNYLDVVSEYLISNEKYDYKVLLEYILIDQKIDSNFKVKISDKETLVINPIKLAYPLDRKAYLDCVDYIQRASVSPSIISLAIDILNTVEIKFFPHSLFDFYSSEIIGEIVFYLTQLEFDEKQSLKQLLINTALDEDDVNTMIKIIKEHL